MPLPARPSPPAPSPAEREQIEREWMHRIRTGDATAFEQLFRAYVEPLCAFVYSYVQSQDAAQEIVQDFFGRLWEHREAIDTPRSTRAYLYASVRNRAVNSLRNRRTELLFRDRALREDLSRQESTRLPAAEESLMAADLAGAIAAAVHDLPPRCREVFTLTRDRHLTYAEVAEVLGIAPKTVEVHMSRALTLLRAKLEPWLRP